MINLFKLPTRTEQTPSLLKGEEDGWFLVTVIIMTTLLTAIGLSIAGYAALQYQETARESFVDNAEQVAEAGIEQTVNELNTNSSFAGYTTAQQFFSNSTQGKGTFTTSITTGSSSAKTITSTSEVYRTASATTPYVTREVQVTVVGTTSTGYSVYSGPGGLILGGSANITNSNVYVNGGITMTGAAQIGTSSNPVDVYAANDLCPTGSNPGSTYPAVCTNGNQPISLQYSTYVYGSVCATGQTSTGPDSNFKTGSTGSGLESGCTAPVSPPTVYGFQAQESAVSTTASGSSNTYVCNSYPFNRTWTGNLELTGNVTIGGSCNLTVDGNVYITGSLTFDGAATMTVASSLGSTQPVVLVGGTVNVSGSAAVNENSSKAGVEFVSMDSNDTACNSSCTSISGTALYNTQAFQTVSVGGAVNVPGCIFDAVWGEVTLAGSGVIGAAEGQTVNMSGAGSVVFGTELSSGNETWSITSYQPVY
jgi:Tfp pilus assembly protein PilX